MKLVVRPKCATCKRKVPKSVVSDKDVRLGGKRPWFDKKECFEKYRDRLHPPRKGRKDAFVRLRAKKTAEKGDTAK